METLETKNNNKSCFPLLHPPSQLIDVSQFRSFYKNLIEDIPLPQDFQVCLDLSVEEVKIITPFDQVEEAIKADSVVPVEEMEIVGISSSRKNEAQLYSIKEDTVTPKKKGSRNEKYISSLIPQNRSINSTQPNHFQPIDESDVILEIAFFHPQKHIKTHEYLVLGSQKLSELRDLLYCLSDEILAEITSTSSMFFIEGIFYPDTRTTDKIDYTKFLVRSDPESLKNGDQNQSNIRNFPRLDFIIGRSNTTTTTTSGATTPQPDSETEKNTIKSAPMENTTWSDLKIRVGAPYFWIHHGNCEHIITITDLRLIHKNDVKNRNDYPVLQNQTKTRRRKCRVCDIYPAKWVTYGDRLSLENPCFYCEHCYRLLHYSFEGDLLYNDFQVYRYYHE